jgi:Ca2+-binding RTX toxin-like protein
MTSLYLSASDVSAVTPSGAETTRWRLSGSPGAAQTARLCNKNTVAGPTVPLLVTDSQTAGTDGNTVAWYSDPVAPVTIAGAVTASLFGVESASTANSAPCIGVYRCAPDGTVLATIADPAAAGSQGALEFATSSGAKTCTLTAGMVTDTALGLGERLKVTLCIDDAADQGGSGSMTASGRSAQLTVNGATGAQIAFTETIVSVAQSGFAVVAGRSVTPVRYAPTLIT